MAGFIWGIITGFAAGVIFSLILGDYLGRRLRKKQALNFIVVRKEDLKGFGGYPEPERPVIINDPPLETNPGWHGPIHWKQEDEP